MNVWSQSPGWADLARHANACVETRLTPQQQLQRLCMLRAMLEEMSAGLDLEADAAAERHRNLVRVPNANP